MKSIWLLALLGLGATNLACATEFSFGLPVRLTLSRNTVDNVAIGDANGDGRKDLAVTSMNPNGQHLLSLFLQHTNGVLAAPVDLWMPDVDYYNTYPVTFVDLDGNGTDEIVIGKALNAIAVVRLSAGGVLSAVDHAARRGCRFLTTADLNGDGDMDIVCHDFKSTITLFYGDGTGAITSTVDMRSSAGLFGLENDFKSVQVADVTGDGRPDLLVTASSVNSFFVHPNNGFGGFWPATAYVHPWTPTGVWPAAIAALDLDGDGSNEVVTASPDNRPDAALNIYRRAVNGYLELSQRIPLYDSPTALIADDVDGDGGVDLLVGHYGFNAVTLLRGGVDGLAGQARNELPGFGNSIELYRHVGHTNAIALGDINGDGCKDLAGATYSGVMLLYGCRPFVNTLPVSDFDGDGVSDLLWRLEETGENYLWQWADLGAWQACALPCPVPMGSSWMAQGIGDFDGDGNSEVFWRNRGSGENQIMKMIFYPYPITGVTNPDWQVVGSGDFDGDDRSDLLWRNARTGANTIWKSANPATTQATTRVADLRWKVVGVGDFDGDSRSDILWRHSTSGRNVIWRGGQSTFPQPLVSVTDPAWQVVGTGDFNGDGRDDVAWRNRSTGANAIWQSANAATKQAVMGVRNLAWTVAAVGDYNGDGRSDLFWRNTATGDDVIWRSADARLTQAVATWPAAMQLIR